MPAVLTGQVATVRGLDRDVSRDIAERKEVGTFEVDPGIQFARASQSAQFLKITRNGEQYLPFFLELIDNAASLRAVPILGRSL
jgi:hypothetical protein